MLKIENLPKMVLHLKHMSENFTSLWNKSLQAVYIGQHCWVQHNSSHFHEFISTSGFPKTQKWLYLEKFQLISSNQKHFNIK